MADAIANEMWLTDGVLGRRVVGWMIDLVLLGLVLLATKVVLLVFGILTLGLGFFLLGGLVLVPPAYTFLWVASSAQATPGQSLAGLRVVRDDDLGRPTSAQALVYAAAYWFSMASGAVWLLVAFFTRRGRCLHDIVSGVAVVRGRALAEFSPAWTQGGSVR